MLSVYQIWQCCTKTTENGSSIIITNHTFMVECCLIGMEKMKDNLTLMGGLTLYTIN